MASLLLVVLQRSVGQMAKSCQLHFNIVYHLCFLTGCPDDRVHRAVSPSADAAQTLKATALSMRLENGMHLLLSQLTVIVDRVSKVSVNVFLHLGHL